MISDLQPESNYCLFNYEVYGNVGQDGRKIKFDEILLPANLMDIKGCNRSLSSGEIYKWQNKRFYYKSFSHTGPRRGKNFSISSDAFQIARIMKGFQKPILDVGNLEC